MATTRAELDQLANLINVALDDVDPHTAHYIQGAYGRVRLVRDQGSVEVSPSLNRRELEQWMRAFHAGIIAGKQAGAADLGRALTDMVDPITIIRTAGRSLDEDRQGDPGTISRLRSAAAQLNRQIVDLRERYPHPGQVRIRRDNLSQSSATPPAAETQT